MGSDAAIEAADIVVMDDDLRRIPRVVGIARRTLRIVKANIVFALTVKILVLILGALGIANMWAAVFADVGVAIICIINSMRILTSGRH
jgi:Cd2+/Zn2+-exporting ATPase